MIAWPAIVSSAAMALLLLTPLALSQHLAVGLSLALPPARLSTPWPVLAAAMSVGEQQDADAERGALAPAGCWCVEAGNVAGTGAAFGGARPLKLEKDWEFRVDGVLEGAPRVWHDHVLVAEREGADRRRLYLLSLSTGKILDRFVWQSARPLESCVWDRAVALRAGPRRLSVLDFGTGRLRERWSRNTEGDASGPLLLGRDLYLREGGDLVCRDAAKGAERWRHRGNFCGELALRGGHLYAVEYRRARAYLVAVDAEHGTPVGSVLVGHHAGEVPDRNDPLRVQVFGKQVIVHHVRGVPSETGITNTTLVRRSTPGGRLQLSFGTLLKTVDDLVPWQSGWVGEAILGSRDPVLSFDPGGGAPYEIFATREQRPRMVRPGVSPSRVGNLLWSGSRAVDLGTREILYSLPFDPSARPVPVGDRVLVRRAERTLVCFRETRGGDDSRPRLVSRQFAATRREGNLRGRVVLSSGEQVDGAFAIDGNGSSENWRLVARATTAGPPQRGFDEVLWVEDSEGRGHWAGAGASAVKGIAVLWRHQQAEGFARLAVDAVEVGDLEAATRMIDAAQHRGGGALSARAEVLLAAARQRPSSVGGARERAVVQQRERELVELPAKFVLQRARRLPVECPVDLRIDLLREVLRLRPNQAGAVELIRAMLPPGARPAEPFEALDWLDFLEAALRSEVEILDDQALIGESKDAEVRKLAALRKTWRKDLVAVRSPQLVVITPLRNPGRIARTLALGEQVCDHLDQMFSFAGLQRPGGGRLLLLLYESQEEYQQRAGMSVAEAEWTSGHYSPRERLARLYLPADEDGFEQVRGTFVHELTHHWCYERCPLFTETEARTSGVRTPGFWVVEGFASLMESFEYDLRRRSYQSHSFPDALDVLSSAAPELSVDWTRLFALDNLQFSQLDRGRPHVVALTRWLGRGRSLGDTGFFYVQASATCHYLFFAEGGRHRRSLLTYLGDYMAGRETRLSIEAAFGMKAAELGRRVEQHAQQTRDSWR